MAKFLRIALKSLTKLFNKKLSTMFLLYLNFSLLSFEKFLIFMPKLRIELEKCQHLFKKLLLSTLLLDDIFSLKVRFACFLLIKVHLKHGLLQTLILASIEIHRYLKNEYYCIWVRFMKSGQSIEMVVIIRKTLTLKQWVSYASTWNADDVSPWRRDENCKHLVAFIDFMFWSFQFNFWMHSIFIRE